MPVEAALTQAFSESIGKAVDVEAAVAVFGKESELVRDDRHTFARAWRPRIGRSNELAGCPEEVVGIEYIRGP